MFVGITLRYNTKDTRELFTISKNFKDIFDKLGVTIIPICQTSNLDDLADLCSFLILTGSPIHVDSKLYNEEKQIDYESPYSGEDELDYLLIKKFRERNKPILGICRGIQVLNVYYGGTLNQYVPNHEGVNHKINIESESFLSKLYSCETMVNSTHTQALKKVADNFKVTATSDDNIIEAIECGNVIGVQWHPELMNDIEFFKNFINEYCQYK